MLIEGQVAVVLGGASGIGKATCRALLSKGAKVSCGDVADETSLQDLRREFLDRILFIRCDATVDADVKNLFRKTTDHFGKLPEIVLTSVATINEFDWLKCIDVNISASIRLVNEAIALMGVKNGGKGGSVVLTSSISGLQPEAWGPVYSASKHAIVGFTRSWAEDQQYRLHGIRFNCLCPGAIDTPFLKLIKNSYFTDDHQRRIDASPKIQPEAVAKAFIRITEDDTINGSAVLVSANNGFRIHEFPSMETLMK